MFDKNLIYVAKMKSLKKVCLSQNTINSFVFLKLFKKLRIPYYMLINEHEPYLSDNYNLKRTINNIKNGINIWFVT